MNQFSILLTLVALVVAGCGKEDVAKVDVPIKPCGAQTSSAVVSKNCMAPVYREQQNRIMSSSFNPHTNVLVITTLGSLDPRKAAYLRFKMEMPKQGMNGVALKHATFDPNSDFGVTGIGCDIPFTMPEAAFVNSKGALMVSAEMFKPVTVAIDASADAPMLELTIPTYDQLFQKCEAVQVSYRVTLTPN